MSWVLVNNNSEEKVKVYGAVIFFVCVGIS